MKEKTKGRLWPAVYVLLFFLTAGTVLWLFLNMPSYLILMGAIGLFSALGLFLHRALRRDRKPVAHLSSECVLCRQCVATCAYGSVELTLGLDVGWRDLIA